MEDAAGLRNWLTLVRSPGFGPRAFRALAEALDSEEPARILDCSDRQLRAAGLSDNAVKALHDTQARGVDADLAWLDAADNRHLIGCTNPRFPARLRAIADPPLALFATGDLDLLSVSQLAIVGSRNPTHSGRKTAFEFARHLAASGLAITSGLAEGIDTAAHEGALAADGMTIAVMGTGPDRIYPARNRDLAHLIAASGLILSEYPPGTAPSAGHFPRRNRIIAGLSVGVLVVEAADKSGSLITARMATEYDREVFAIPGSIHSPLARGCHKLIRQGAKLVETAADILEELPPSQTLITANPAPAAFNDVEAPCLDPEYLKLLSALGFDPEDMDTLAERTGLTPEALSSMLSDPGAARLCIDSSRWALQSHRIRHPGLMLPYNTAVSSSS